MSISIGTEIDPNAPAKKPGLISQVESKAATPLQTAPRASTPSAPAATRPSRTRAPASQGTDYRTMSSADTHLNRITSKDSANMQRAGAQGRQAVQGRGLINSSMGAEAAQAAMVDRATPLAVSEAQGYQALDQISEKGKIDTRIQELRGAQALQQIGAQGRNQTSLARLQGDISSRLQAERAEIDKALQTADGELRERLLNRRGELDLELRETDFNNQLALNKSNANRQFIRDKILNGYQLAGNNAERLHETGLELVKQISGQNAVFNETLGAIMTSEHLSETQKTNLINKLTDLHFQSKQETAGLTDYNIVNGQVVYNSPGGGAESVVTPEETPYNPPNYNPNDYFDDADYGYAY